ncbi:PREDICTED: kelch domain-containing protein 7A [Cyprinodon variegatus]|uniref:kelch domain-containing protein 7A n=1 Tax=Cyprinodon variegatus TaxID=28743 RepID=UPI000742CDC8|nr:PREDICTED: kelch domain-containing protein 7A [Cyprinodon variegatus]
MPIEDLRDQFDMQLLLKLSFSAAAVLLVSWAYRFYRSKDVKETTPCGGENTEIQNTASHEYKRTRQKLCFQDKDDERKHDSATDDLKSDSTHGIHVKFPLQQVDKSKEVCSPSNIDQNKCMDKEMLQKDLPTISCSNIAFESALEIHDPTDDRMTAITGRRSPCFWTKHEGGVGVGRELRQDLEHQGVYSSFLSKAKIKVEDATVVLDGSGHKIVNGKIYDYYVESKSHSVKDSKPLLAHYERNTVTNRTYRKENISFSDSPSSGSPIIMRDLVLPSSSAAEDFSEGSLRHPERPSGLYKESYESAERQLATSFPFQVSRNSPPVTPSRTPSSNDSVFLQTAKDKKEVDVENSASFMQLPAEIFLGTDLEVLKSNLDLGNCLEILHQAKKTGHKSVHQAALEVMSDNYLQVLRDPTLYGQLTANERERIRRQRMRGRRFVIVADMVPQDWLRNTAGQTAKSELRNMSSAMYYYDDYKDVWHSLCLIPQEVISKACAMCTMDNYLFVAVGCQGSDREMIPSKRVFCYNPLTSIWKEISPMNEARPRCKLAALEGYIYAIGGECLSSVERYDPRQDRWTFVAPLPNDTFAVAHHVTVCSGELFVSGGTLRYMLLRYNPQTNTWRPSLIVGNKDKSIDMVAVGKFLYRFEVNPLLGVSVYRYHTVARLWYECSSKRLLHCPAFQCIAMDGTVYCLSRHFTMKFEADEISPAFADEEMSVLSKAKGLLFPFVLSLPDMNPRQTSV